MKDHFSKAWLYINIALVALCALAIIYGVGYAISYTMRVNDPASIINFVDKKGFFQVMIEGICLSFLFPSAFLLWIYSFISSGTFQEMNPGWIIFDLILSVCLVACLVVNALKALALLREHHQNPVTSHLAKLNCLLAFIPPIFIVLAFILLLFVEIPRPHLSASAQNPDNTSFQIRKSMLK